MDVTDKKSKLSSAIPIQSEYSSADFSVQSTAQLDISTSHPSTEAQPVMVAFIQLSKDLMSKMDEPSSQVGHLSSRIDDMKIFSSRSRSRFGSRHSSQHRLVTSENTKFAGFLPPSKALKTRLTIAHPTKRTSSKSPSIELVKNSCPRQTSPTPKR